MGDTRLLDYMVGVLQDPFEKFHMGITAENVAAEFHVSRDDMDTLAADHRRAAAAIENGVFDTQIVPVESAHGRHRKRFFIDEHVKATTTSEALSTMKPAFKKDGVVTPENRRASL